MKLEQLCKASLPTFNEELFINCVKNMKRSDEDKAFIIAYKNTLSLAKCQIDNYQLNAILIKDYIFNSRNNKYKKIVELEEILDYLESYNLNDSKNAEEIITLISNYLKIDNDTRYMLCHNYINNIENKYNRFSGIKPSDADFCIKYGKILNQCIENKVVKKEDVKIYKKVSSK